MNTRLHSLQTLPEKEFRLGVTVFNFRQYSQQPVIDGSPVPTPPKAKTETK
jgi:hypothetical protein